jgi:hypothetical protein
MPCAMAASRIKAPATNRMTALVEFRIGMKTPCQSYSRRIST